MKLLGTVEQLRQSRVQCLQQGELSLVLIYQSGEFSLLDNLCPHKAAALCDGEVYGDEIECPWHKARFNIKTGEGLNPLAGKGVKSWPLSIQGDQLYAELPPGA